MYVEGEFSIEPGSSVTLQDADGTRGTVTDGSNAKIVEGSIDTTVTGTPSGVSGSDGQLATEGLEIVDTSGITASPEFAIALGPIGAAGLQYDPMVDMSGSQYAPDFGAARVQYDPSIRAAGLQSICQRGLLGPKNMLIRQPAPSLPWAPRSSARRQTGWACPMENLE